MDNALTMEQQGLYLYDEAKDAVLGLPDSLEIDGRKCPFVTAPTLEEDADTDGEGGMTGWVWFDATVYDPLSEKERTVFFEAFHKYAGYCQDDCYLDIHEVSWAE